MILEQLAELSRGKDEAIHAWLASEREVAAPHLTTSVDMRHDGRRLVPVDVNIYPAGFQNLSEHGRERAAFHFASGIKNVAANASRILIVPENHTRNLPYLDNLASLQTILHMAGFEVQIGSLIANSDEGLVLERAGGDTITQHALVKKGQQLTTRGGFMPDVILLNNDGTSGIPPMLEHITQPVLPSPLYGWFQRRKSCHFKAYDQLSQRFALEFGIDHWLLSAYFTCARNIDFKHRQGVDELAQKVDTLAEKIRAKHAEYGISDDPYIYVKADSGTYGMGIMQVRDGSELLEMNKKQRNKMHVIKEGAEVHDVILQEGIKTVDVVDGKAAEPMVYLVDGVPVGGMFRANASRDAFENLNASGMEYIGMCDESEKAGQAHQVKGCDFAAYGLIAVISALAAGRENYTAEAQHARQECA